MRGISLAVVLLFFVAAGVATATASSSSQVRYYLALGDSVAYGVQPAKVGAGLRPSGFNTGYVDVLAKRLRALAPSVRVVNYSCPGESTRTFMAGGCPGRGDVKGLHDEYEGAQLDAALGFLHAHRSQAGLVTLTLWGNDFGEALDACKNKPSCVQSRTPRVVAANLSVILRRLRGAAPQARIVVTGTWNPNADNLAESDPFFRSLNATIKRVAGRTGARFADTFPVFNPRGTPARERARVCATTFGCKGDPHPTDAGYRAMAGVIWAASGYRS